MGNQKGLLNDEEFQELEVLNRQANQAKHERLGPAGAAGALPPQSENAHEVANSACWATQLSNWQRIMRAGWAVHMFSTTHRVLGRFIFYRCTPEHGCWMLTA